jgi:periplasmic protein TonB
MFDPDQLSPKTERRVLPPPVTPQGPQQRRLMIVALTLLLVTLGFVLYRDRDFWFPDTQEADQQPIRSASTVAATQPTQAPPPAILQRKRRAHHAPPADVSRMADAPTPPATITRTVLPPLEVEVVAGSTHKTFEPGTSSVRVDLQPDSPSGEVSAPSAESTHDTAASVTDNAAERTQMSPTAADVVTHSVRPGYPMLARQMKVQGSVILLALIGRDGLIQDLRVLSGPPILATAAQEAVRQWHFKPHYEAGDSVETQARITVNFTISTN